MTQATELRLVEPVFDLPEPHIQGELLPLEVADAHGEVSRLETFAVDGRTHGSRRTMLFFQPWSDTNGRIFSQDRFRAVAADTRSHVLSIDSPGIGLNNSELTTTMDEQLRQGNFEAVCEMMWAAILKHPHSGLDDLDELVLGFHSLGSVMTSKMLRYAPEGIEIDRVLLMENPIMPSERERGTDHAEFVRLAGRFSLFGASGQGHYFAETWQLGWPDKTSSLAQFAKCLTSQKAHWLYGVAMTKTEPILDDLAVAWRRGTITKETVLHILNGTNSRISPTDLNDLLAHYLQESSIESEVVRVGYIGETHAVNNSFPRAVAILRENLS